MANYLLTQTGEEVQDILNQAPDTEAGLQQEVTNREQADTAMQQAITAEATARADADATLDGKIDAETSRAEAAEGTLDDKIDQEVADRTEAVTAEATARQQADTSLQQAITAEATARVDADATLDGKIDAETTRAEAAEGTLTDAINKEVTDRTAAVAAEVTARQQADTSLQQAISTEAQARSAADTEILGNLQTESRTRLNADTDLQDHIDDEETRAKAAEATLQANIDALGQSGGAAVAAERERAEAAESTLDGKIDAETDRAEAAEGTLTDAIAQEVTDRTAAVSAEATARQQADTALQTAINGKQDTIADLADIRSGAAAGATAYQKPATGIPATDMSAGVQTSLDKADSALQEHQSLADYYTKSEVDNLITTPDQEYVSVTATAQTTAVTDLLPSTGAADTIYRVGNWDGTQYDPTMYALFAWNGTTYVCLAVRSFVGEVYDISVNHPDGQGNPTPYADLTAALGTDGANIPADIRRGGMSIKFIQGTVQSSDNKYVQARCMAQNFTTDVTQWQGVDDEPTAGSENLVKSGGVANAVYNVIDLFEQGLLNNTGQSIYNGDTRRIRSKFIKVNGKFKIGVKDGFGYNYFLYSADSEDSFVSAGTTWSGMFYEAKELEHQGYIKLLIGKPGDVAITAKEFNGFLFQDEKNQFQEKLVLSNYLPISVNWYQSAIQTANGLDSVTSNPARIRSGIISVNGKVVIVGVNSFSFNYFLYDINGNFISHGGTWYNSVTITHNGYIRLLVSKDVGGSTSITPTDGSNITVYSPIELGRCNSLKGRKLSILGDSISTYAGEIPSGYEHMYPYGNVDLPAMWWSKLVNEDGMVKEIINAWSGSCVSNIRPAGRVPFCDESRLSNLGSPDIIILFGGINDWMNLCELGEYYQTGDYDLTKFRQAYEYVVRQILIRYPKAKLIAFTPCQSGRETTSPTFPQKTNVGYLYEYVESIVTICRKYGVCCVNMYELSGINYINGHADSNDVPTTDNTKTIDGLHPNREGMCDIYNAAKKYID